MFDLLRSLTPTDIALFLLNTATLIQGLAILLIVRR